MSEGKVRRLSSSGENELASVGLGDPQAREMAAVET